MSEIVDLENKLAMVHLLVLKQSRKTHVPVHKGLERQKTAYYDNI